MKILVTYESRGGTTRRTAEAIAAAARGEGHDAVVIPTREAASQAVADADMLLVGSWVEGFVVAGVGPAKAVRRFLAGLPALDGKLAAAFCTYAFNPRGTLATMERALVAAGARVVGKQAFNRRRPEQGAEAFARSVLSAHGEPVAGE